MPERFNPATHRTDERARGRHEVRTYTTVKLGPRTSHRIARDYWSGLSAVGRVVSQRTVKGKTTIETRYHLLSDVDVERYAKAARGHWGIENSAHWVLDVAFLEHRLRQRTTHPCDLMRWPWVCVDGTAPAWARCWDMSESKHCSFVTAARTTTQSWWWSAS